MADEPSYQEFPSAYLLQDFIISLQRDWQDMNIASQKTLQLQAAVLARMAGHGEVVVPVAHTAEMQQAARDAEMACMKERVVGYGTRLSRVWAAMLAARPNQGGPDDAG